MIEMGKNKSEAEQNEIDRILATEDALVPSSGFLATVMERVREEAAAQAPISFPWKRALPGMVVVAGVLGWDAFELVRQGLPTATGFTVIAPHISVEMGWQLEQAGWVALAVGASLFSWLISRRLAGRAGLL